MLRKYVTAISAVLLASAILLTGCGGTGDKTPVAKVDGAVITLGEFNKLYKTYLDYYQITDDTASDSVEYAKQIRSQVLESLINKKVAMAEAKKQGFDKLTDEEIKTIEKSVDDSIASQLESYTEQAKTADATLIGDALTKKAQELLDKYMKDNGLTRESMIADEKESASIQKLYDKAVEGITVTDEEVKTAYDDKVEADRVSYSDDPSTYEQLTADATPYYTPAGVRRIKHILIKLTDEQVQAIQALRTKNDTSGADAARVEALKTIQTKADDVLKSLSADGSNFDTVMNEKSEDTGLSSYPNGYFVVQSGSGMVAEFTAGAFALKNVGEISGLVATDYGYHILRYDAAMPEGPAKFEDVKDAVSAEALDTKKNTTFNTTFEGWLKAAKIERYNDKVKLDDSSSTSGSSSEGSSSESASAVG